MKISKQVITVYEQEVLAVGDQGNNLIFSEEYLQQLASLQSRLPARLYQLAYRSVRFGSVAGVIQLPQLLIEILPKISRQTDPRPVRKVWTQLLQSSGHLPFLGDLHPQLLTQPGALVHVLEQAFLKEVHQLTRQGLIRQYQSSEGQQPFLRGKLLLHQQIRHNLIRQDRFYVRSQAHQADHPLNQRLKQALRIIEASSEIRSLVKQALTHFQNVTNLPLHHPWEEFAPFNHITQRYGRALSLAKLICLGYLGGTFVGEDVGFALLFDMSQVFEVLIHRYLRTLAETYGWKLQYQPSRAFWESKQLRPDFTIDIPGRSRVVIDTKWKILKRPEPNDDDLRQIFAYTQIFEAQRGILLYPNVHNLSPALQSFSTSKTQSANCEIQFIKLEDNPEEQLYAMLMASG